MSMNDKKVFKKVKNLFNGLKIDPSNVLFVEEKLDRKLSNRTKEVKI